MRDLIVGTRLKLDEFTWERTRTQATQVGPGRDPVTVDVVRHKPTGFSFTFDFDAQMRHHAILRPGRDTPIKREFPGDWDLQLGYVKNWLGYVKREYEAPDLWADLGEQPELGTPAAHVANTPFTPDEQARIEAILRGALESARTMQELTPEQDRTLEQKVDYLVEAAQRLPRLDWRSVLVGAMVEVMVAEALPPGAVRHVLEFALRGLGQLFGGPDFTELPRPGP